MAVLAVVIYNYLINHAEVKSFSISVSSICIVKSFNILEWVNGNQGDSWLDEEKIR